MALETAPARARLLARDAELPAPFNKVVPGLSVLLTALLDVAAFALLLVEPALLLLSVALLLRPAKIAAPLEVDGWKKLAVAGLIVAGDSASDDTAADRVAGPFA